MAKTNRSSLPNKRLYRSDADRRAALDADVASSFDAVDSELTDVKSAISEAAKDRAARLGSIREKRGPVIQP